MGKGSKPGVFGEFGFRSRTERGDRLIEHCLESNLVITNTMLSYIQEESTHRVLQEIEKNQIDFIIVNNRFRNAIQLEG